MGVPGLTTETLMRPTSPIPGIYRRMNRESFKYRLIQGVSFCIFIFLLSMPAFSQRVALHTNTVDWLTLSPNLGAEFAISPRLSLGISVAGSPFTLKNDMYFKHIRVQPELRFWPGSLMTGHAIGITAAYQTFDIGLKQKGFYGDAYMAGLTYGYNWILSRRWNLEASAGLGAVYYRMARYTPGTPHPQPDENGRKAVPVKLAVSLIYILK